MACERQPDVYGSTYVDPLKHKQDESVWVRGVMIASNGGILESKPVRAGVKYPEKTTAICGRMPGRKKVAIIVQRSTYVEIDSASEMPFSSVPSNKRRSVDQYSVQIGEKIEFFNLHTGIQTFTDKELEIVQHVLGF